jgi:two-component system OmpR family sensor kinase/two-component system sensor histidine kinase BaeS
MRRFIFWRFAMVFGAIALLFLAALAIITFFWFRPWEPGFHRPGAFFLVACGVPLVFLAMASLLGSWAFRRIGSPIAEIMSAAEAVAEGELDVRVHENYPGQWGRLASSFNRMTAELARTEQQRRNLTADVAHELRTPLHILQGNLEGILDGVYAPSPEHIAAALEETRLLARLVGDLQTLSLAEAGQLPLRRVPLSVEDLMSDVATSFSGQAAEQGVAIQLDLQDDGGQLELVADPDRLDQVLSNLVANALRYTPAGGHVILRARSIPDGIQLAVKDSGSGIPADDLPFLFDRFWRGDRARSRSSGSHSGLGLAIAKQLVQLHGGRISVDSQPGVGTSFTIELPGRSRTSDQSNSAAA